MTVLTNRSSSCLDAMWRKWVVVTMDEVVVVELDFEPESRTAKIPAMTTTTDITASSSVADRESPLRGFHCPTSTFLV